MAKNNWNWTKDDRKQPTVAPAQDMVRNLPAAAQSFLGPFSQLYQDMDHMFGQTFRSFGLPAILSAQGNLFKNGSSMFIPSVDISSTDREYTIDVEVPGMNENDIRLDLTREGQLCICGEKRLENQNQDKDFQRIERTYGSFSRTLTLPEDADPEGIRADFHNGLLTVNIPRRDSASQSRRIDISAGEPGPMRGRRHGQQEGRAEGRPEGRAEGPMNNNAAPKRAA